jgi:hypothetical protein
MPRRANLQFLTITYRLVTKTYRNIQAFYKNIPATVGVCTSELSENGTLRARLRPTGSFRKCGY